MCVHERLLQKKRGIVGKIERTGARAGTPAIFKESILGKARARQARLGTGFFDPGGNQAE
jgi:hypothetical protein